MIPLNFWILFKKACLLFLVCTISFTCNTSVLGYGKPKSTEQNSTEKSFVTTLKTITPHVETYGTAKAIQKWPLVSEVSGKVLDKQRVFIPGKVIKKGDPILNIDNSLIKYNYYAQKSTLIKGLTQLISDFRVQYPKRVGPWRSFLNKFSITDHLPALPKNISSKERNYLSVKGIYNNYYALLSLENQLKKYTFLAPFDGTISHPKVTHNDFVTPGTPLGTFIGQSTYALTVNLPLKQSQLLTIGNPVVLTNKTLNTRITSRILSIDPHLDPTTQSIAIYIEFDSKLPLDNMIMHCHISGTPLPKVSSIPRKYISDNTVILLKNNKWLPHPISIKHIQHNDALVTGIPNNSNIILPTN